MHVCMYICISGPVNLRHLDYTIAQCSPQAHTTTKHSTWSPLAMKLLNTPLLHAGFRLLLTSPIAPARATHMLVLWPYWQTSFAPRGQEHFHCLLR